MTDPRGCAAIVVVENRSAVTANYTLHVRRQDGSTFDVDCRSVNAVAELVDLLNPLEVAVHAQADTIVQAGQWACLSKFGRELKVWNSCFGA